MNSEACRREWLCLSSLTGSADYVRITSFSQRLGSGDVRSVVAVGIVNDNTEEVKENFTVSLRTSSPGVNVSPSSAVITILDDDGQGSSCFKYKQILSYIMYIVYYSYMYTQGYYRLLQRSN